MKSLLVGLTGGIASGKSQAAKYLQELGACIVDTDQISRKVIKIPEVRKKLQKSWPQAFHRGTLNRKALRRIVFSSPPDRKKLNRLTHPYILRQAFEEIRKCRKKICVLVAPLLIETGIHTQVDSVWVMDVPKRIQVRRLMDREKISRQEAEKILQSQLPSKRKLAHADFAVRNGGSLAKTKDQIRKGWQWLQTAKKIPSAGCRGNLWRESNCGASNTHYK